MKLTFSYPVAGEPNIQTHKLQKANEQNTKQQEATHDHRGGKQRLPVKQEGDAQGKKLKSKTGANKLKVHKTEI